MSSSQFVTQRLRRILVIGLLACLGVPASAAARDLPDLVADPPERPLLEVDGGETREERLLLRFDGHVHNSGAGPLEIRRTPGVVEQVLRDGSTLEVDPLDPSRLLAPDAMKFENTDGHNHWHLQRIAKYSLYDGTGVAPVAPVMKVGFCLVDSLRVTGGADRQYGSTCARNQPNAAQVSMGVSSGWRDLYDRNLPFQWVDVSETQPGTYRLRSEIDPENLVAESDETNVPAESSYAVPGYVAMVGDAYSSPPPPIVLAASQRGTPAGAARFKIVEGPQHGTLSVPTGQWFTNAGVTYTADDENTPAPDRFRYVADDTGSDYPRYPGRATVLVGHDPAPRVAMSAVPEKLRAGMAVDLRADAWDGSTPMGVDWSVTGGGTIDQATGIYTAPPTVPSGGKVTVKATIDGGTAFDAMDIEIMPPPPPPQPAPRPTVNDTAQDLPVAGTPPSAPTAPPVVTPRRRTPIGSVRVRRVGPQIVITVVPRVSGRVRATLMRSKRKLGTCTVRVRAKKSALCRLRYRRRATAIALTLVRRDGKIERRRVKVPAARS